MEICTKVLQISWNTHILPVSTGTWQGKSKIRTAHHSPCKFFDVCIAAREIVVPMIPDVEAEDDTSYFEEYDDAEEHTERVRLLIDSTSAAVYN